MNEITPQQNDDDTDQDRKENRSLLVDFKILVKFIMVSAIVGFLLSLIFKLSPWLCVQVGALTGAVAAVIWRSFRSAFSNDEDYL